MDDFVDEGDYDGFSFDWDDQDLADSIYFQDDVCLPEQTLTSIPDVRVYSDSEAQICTVCNRIVGKDVVYEINCLFCSKNCWRSALYTAADDLAVGGVSSWPLDMWASYEAKSLLLTLATDSFDAELIIKLLRQFQVSLSPGMFERMLLENVIAFNHFTNFLRKTNQNHLLRHYLMASRLTEQAMIEPYKKIISALDDINVSNARQVIDQLHEFAVELSTNSDLHILKDASLQLAELLQYQLHHNSEWRSFKQRMQLPEDEDTDSESSILAVPLGATIRALVWMDKIVGPNSRAGQLKTMHKVCEDQYRWFVIQPLVKTGNFSDLDSILLEKKWLKLRVQSRLPPERLVFYLHTLEAPETVLLDYLQHCSDQSQAMQLALRLGVYRFAINVCVKDKDQETMKNLLPRIPEANPERSLVLHYLSIPTNQWKVELKEMST